MSVNADADSNLEKELEQARDSLKAFDDRLHDIRKYGFSFVTALLTAQSILIPALGSGSAGNSSIGDFVKLGVLSVTLLLIGALRVLEYMYMSFNEATATRARVIERRLNMELTEVITARYAWAKLGWLATYLYVLFALGVLGVGFFVLPLYYEIALLLFTAMAIAVILELRVVQLDYTAHGHEDWSIDRLQCKVGESVGLTLTNLGEDELPVRVGDFIFKVVREDDWSEVHEEKSVVDITIGPENNFTWYWHTKKSSGGKKVIPGDYRVVPSSGDPKEAMMRKPWVYPLRRKIVVTDA